MQTRQEKDNLGTVQVPKDAYYGSFTARAQENFQISGLSAPSVYKESIGLIKKAAAMALSELGLLDKKLAKAIITACEEFIEGKFDYDYTLDVFQAGAGTPFNMNANEIIANRAEELLGGKKGEYKLVHPNNHVNMAQSTNDVTPTAIRISAMLSLIPLIKSLKNLEESLRKQGEKHKKLIKVGRTHLEDAVPISMGQEFLAYADALNREYENIVGYSGNLQELGIGGTALGTGINTHPKYQSLIIKHLSDLTGIEFKGAKNLVETTNNYNLFGNLSGYLRSLALTLSRIANDLKLMNMGPKAGLSEIILPDVEPGSSIMPGKVNPSIPECVEMIACQVVGNDAAIMMANRGAQLELNVNGPVIMHNLLQSIQILTNGMEMFKEFCTDTIVVNAKHISAVLEGSLCAATALNPYLGYQVTGEIVSEALHQDKSIKQTVLDHQLIDKKDLDMLLSLERTTKPSIPDQKLIKKIQSSTAYAKYRKEIGK